MGPATAREVALGSPTSLVLASQNAEMATAVATAISDQGFSLYTSCDVRSPTVLAPCPRVRRGNAAPKRGEHPILTVCLDRLPKQLP